MPSAAGVVVRAPAKVNLFLEVLGKRPDGYHEIATLMVAVNLFDTLEFREDADGQLTLRCDEPSLPTGPENLIIRAAELLRQRSGCGRGARIALSKRIPLAAGLAGGSSDAAATLVGLNRLWRLDLDTRALTALAAELGSDVAFFFATPAAWCTGRGEIVTPQPLGRPLHLLLVCPDAGLSTRDVYRGVRLPAEPESGEEIRRAATEGNVEAIGRFLHNRLQEPAERLSPEVAALGARLAALSVPGSLMSGSGSTVFALLPDRLAAVQFARQLRRQAPEVRGRPRVFLVRSSV